MDTVSEKSAKILLFDGTTDKYQLWWRRFRAYAQVNKFGNILVDTIDPELPESYNSSESADATDIAKKAVKKNDLAMAAFTSIYNYGIDVVYWSSWRQCVA